MVEKELKFTKAHEWREAQGARRKVGISNFAQEQLGDIVFVEFPEDEKQVKAGDEVCIVESCKATASIYAPIAGRVVASGVGAAEHGAAVAGGLLAGHPAIAVGVELGEVPLDAFGVPIALGVGQGKAGDDQGGDGQQGPVSLVHVVNP